MINRGRSGLLSQVQKKTFVQKLGTIENNENIKQFRNKNNLLVNQEQYYNFDYELKEHCHAKQEQYNYICLKIFSYFSKVQGAPTQCSVLLKQKQISSYINI